MLSKKFLKRYEQYQETLRKIEQAIALSESPIPVEEVILQIGEGWVGEEALGIAIYCALKSTENWSKGVLAAANHSGDSDSTASITGAICGAMLGIEAIPAQWVERVENSIQFKKLAKDMFNIFQCG
jgi:ADP-ribosylglycohydrolase